MNRSNECMRIGQINIRSIYDKRDLLSNYLANTSMDVVLISETWVRETKPFRMKGYQFLSRPRGDGHGGVAILAKNSIKLNEIKLPDLKFVEGVAARTANLDRNILMISVYAAPAKNMSERLAVKNDFERLFQFMNGKSDLILGGDMNAHARMWGCRGNCVRGDLLADLVQDSDLVILNDGSPTRLPSVGQAANAIDLSMATIAMSAQVTWRVAEENLGSDHYMIEMNLADNFIVKEKVEILNGKEWVRRMDEILGENDIESVCQLENEIERVNEICVRTVNRNEVKLKEWWNNEIQFWYDRKRMALREMNRCAHRTPCECRVHLNRTTAKLKKAIRRAKRKSWHGYVSTMTHHTSTKDIWVKFNRVNGKKVSKKNFVLDDCEKGQEFLEMIVNVDNNLNEAEEDVERNAREASDSNLTAEYEWEEFLTVLNRAKFTAPGTNRVSYRMLGQLSVTAKHNLLKILNSAWMSGEIPTKWKESRVVPIPKRDRDVREATNYRGICMLNVLMKLVNGMLKERLDEWVNENDLLPKSTFGFRKNHSAIECVERFVWEVRKDNTKIVAVFLDIERAYDFVVPRKMNQILTKMGLPRKVNEWIYELLDKRKLVLNGKGFTLEKEVSIGLPQGSKLSPLLFNLYTAEVHSVVGEDDGVLQFADDFVVFGRGNTIAQAHGKAQGTLDRVMAKLRSLNLRVNARKSACMGFRMKKNERLNIKIDGELVEQMNVVRYLGIWIDQKMNFGKHMDILADECKRRINVIKRVSKPKWGAHPGVTDLLRKAIVSSKMAYGMSVYGNGVKGGFCKLMRVENACVRLVLGAINSTPIQALYSEVGDSPLNYKREWITVRETVRMMVKGNEFVKEMFERVSERAVFKETFRSEIISANINLLTKIGNRGPGAKPENLKIHTALGIQKKSEMSELVARRMHAELSVRYRQWVSVYTDASVGDDRVGVGVWIPSRNEERIYRVSSSICIMNAELIGMLEGIKLGLNVAEGLGERKIVIFSDSKVSMHLIENGGSMQGNVYVDMIYECVRSEECEVSIQWIPSHLAIRGNEKADGLANRGRMIEDATEYERMDARDVLRMIQANLWNKWEDEYERKSRMTGKKYRELCDAPLRKPFYKSLKGDTRMIRTIERIRMNHGNWKECLHKRRMESNNMCERCAVVEDIEHLLLKCPRFLETRRQFNVLLNARGLTDLMKANVDAYKDIYEYIRLTGINV